jgi:hypothetical protein
MAATHGTLQSTHREYLDPFRAPPSRSLRAFIPVCTNRPEQVAHVTRHVSMQLAKRDNFTR